jgi:hypothetical protein
MLSPNQKEFDFSSDKNTGVETINATKAAAVLVCKYIEEHPHRFTDIIIGNIEHLGPDISGMVDKYPQPLKYGWNAVNMFKPPSGKLQFYTIGGTCIYGDYTSMTPGFVTHWAYLLPSPSKQAGAIK